MIAPRQCDFCRSKDLAWIYPCETFKLPDLAGYVDGWTSDGDWAACEVCADLIQTDQWETLTIMALGTVRGEHDVEHTPQVIQNLQAMQAGFRQHRRGRRHRYVPPPPPLTQVSVYSRALDEQESLRRLLERREVHDAMLHGASQAHGPEKARGLLNITYASVAQSEAGYVSGAVCRLLEQTAQDIPDTTLEPSDLLMPNGFLVIQKPFTLPSPEVSGATSVGGCRYLSWFNYADDAETGQRGGIYVVAWCDLVNPPRTAVATIAPINALAWEFGTTWRASAATRLTPEEIGNGMFIGQWLAALNAFCQQKLITGQRAAPDRNVRRRLEKSGREPSDMLVVELRRIDHRQHEPSGEAKEWSCSWTVSGHWRHQYYPSINDHRPRWISPYLKGDPEKPLRERKRVFAIVH